MRSMVMVGDAPPHSPRNAYNGINWRDELVNIRTQGINIYSVQCLNWAGRTDVKDFFKMMARETNGYHLYLDQFNMIPQMMMAIAYRAMGQDRLETYENELRVSSSGVSNGMKQMFDIMLGKRTTEDIEEENERTYSSYGGSSSSASNSSRSSSVRRATTTGLENLADEDFEMKPCHPSRFQVLDVTGGDVDIKTFSSTNGLVFEKGKGFYEFTKSELIQKNKEIVLQDKTTGHFFEGNMARKMLNLITYDEKKRIKPTDFDQYRVFIQSTSTTRKLVDGTKFLYDSM